MAYLVEELNVVLLTPKLLRELVHRGLPVEQTTRRSRQALRRRRVRTAGRRKRVLAPVQCRSLTRLIVRLWTVVSFEAEMKY